MTSGVPALYFDGRYARAHHVTIMVEDGAVLVSGAGVDRRALLPEVEVSDVIGATPRVVRFADGASFQIDDAGFQELLSKNGVHPSALSRWEQHWPWIVGAPAAFLVTLVLAYWLALPALADFTATHLPPEATATITDHVMGILDRSVFRPTGIGHDRQADIREAFAKLNLTTGVPDQTIDVVFRNSPSFGANAMALPSGTIVITDGLVALARDDREILAILAHEAGHVVRRHGLRQAFQSSALALLIAWYMGDAGGLAAAVPTALLSAKYSRDFEREADAFAADLLRRNGISPGYLADILERLDRTSRARHRSGPVDPEYLSTHPATAERIQWLRGQ
jgi:Zn-dependent protease with chaperone function